MFTRKRAHQQTMAARNARASSSSSSSGGARERTLGSQSVHGDSFRLDDSATQKAAVPHSATLSSDDDNSTLSVPAAPGRAFTTDASEAQTFRPPAPRSAAKKRARVREPRATASVRKSAARLVAERGAARSTARAALDALRVEQPVHSGAAPIAYYNERAPPDAERNVVIDRERFDSLRYDAPREFQDANRPPWAAPLADKQLQQLMTWESLEVMSELEHRSHDWYTLALMVAGLVQVKPEAFVVFRPRYGTQPTRQSILGGYPLPYAARERPQAPTSRRAPPQPAPTPTAPTSEDDVARALDELDRSAQVGGTDSVDEQSAQAQSGPATPLAPLNPIPETPGMAEQTEGARSIFSRARFPQFRREQRSAPPPLPDDGLPFYARGFVPESAPSAPARNEIAAALPWASRSIATGVVFLAPEYTAARDSAHMLVVSRADRLADVALGDFVRRGDSASVQHRVRVQFARLIAHMYNIAKHNANRSSKLAHDMANYTAGAEQIVQWFVNRIDYEPRSRTFSDTGAQNARDRRPLARFGGSGFVGDAARARSDDSTRVYGSRSGAAVDPLLYTPGTLLGSLTSGNT